MVEDIVWVRMVQSGGSGGGGGSGEVVIVVAVRHGCWKSILWGLQRYIFLQRKPSLQS